MTENESILLENMPSICPKCHFPDDITILPESFSYLCYACGDSWRLKIVKRKPSENKP